MEKVGNGVVIVMSIIIFKVFVFCCRKMGWVLFLEVGKDFVDMFFSFFFLLIGIIIYMLKNVGRVYVKLLILYVLYIVCFVVCRIWIKC